MRLKSAMMPKTYSLKVAVAAQAKEVLFVLVHIMYTISSSQGVFTISLQSRSRTCPHFVLQNLPQ